MAKHELEVVIDETGEVHLETKGMKGKRCLEVAQQVAAAVGEIKDKQLKPEYYQQETDITGQVRVKDNTD